MKPSERGGISVVLGLLDCMLPWAQGYKVPSSKRFDFSQTRAITLSIPAVVR